MSRSQSLVRPTVDLLHRAAEASLNSARIIAQSIKLIACSVELMQKSARTYERKYVGKVEAQRTRIQLRRPAPLAPMAGSVERAILLPLTPARLLEVAEEFRGLAATAATPESRAAFEDLVFRYTALAAGYDDGRVGSRMMH